MEHLAVRRSTSWFPIAMLIAIAYPVIGVAFAVPASSTSHRITVAWRLAAWAVAAAIFAIHVWYEHSRDRKPLRAALHVAAAVALGAFILAVWVIVHAHWIGASQSPLALLALVLFPVISGVPAFLVALPAAFVLANARRSTPPASGDKAADTPASEHRSSADR